MTLRAVYNLLLVTSLAALACGGGAIDSQGQSVDVQVQPSSTRAQLLENVVFTAAVTGTADTSVTWSVQEGATGGIVTGAGLYSASSSPGTYHIVATSRADPSKAGVATVTVGTPPACAENAQSAVWNVTGWAQAYNYRKFGNYIVQASAWGNSFPMRMWVNNETCWGVSSWLGATTESNGWIAGSPATTRGYWNHGDMNNPPFSDAGQFNWVVKSGLGQSITELTKLKVHWATTHATKGYPEARWWQLMDVLLDDTARIDGNTSVASHLVDLQLMVNAYDSQWASLVYTIEKTIGGVKWYCGLSNDFNRAGGVTITMFRGPRVAAGNGYRYGASVTTTDVKQILDFWSSPNPLDDSGRPINDQNGNRITSTPVINPAWRLIAVNLDFEVLHQTTPQTPWVMTNAWVAVNDEPDGPSTP